jgi:hypothetical protein
VSLPASRRSQVVLVQAATGAGVRGSPRGRYRHAGTPCHCRGRPERARRCRAGDAWPHQGGACRRSRPCSQHRPATFPPTPTTGPPRPSGTGRAIAYISGGTAVLRRRSGSDVTSSYPEVAAALALAAGWRTLILDGELTAFGDELPSFALLQGRLHVARPAPSLVAAVPVTFIAFDLLWQASRSLLRNPYAQRRALLDGLGLAADHLSVPPAFPGQARDLTDASRDLGLEGVVLKRLASIYQPGQRSGEWLKIRNRNYCR